MSKVKFKNFIKEKVLLAAFSELMTIKEGHSKGSNIEYNKFETQQYLKTNKLNYEEKCLLFKLRSRMTKVKANFSSMYEDINCKKCQMNTPESDAHLLDCSKIIENCPTLFNNFETEYLDIFGDIEKQVCATKLYMKVFKVMEKFNKVESSQTNQAKSNKT